MRLFLIASILIIQSQIQAQGDFISYRFQVDPKQYTDYNLNFTVIDRRADTSNIGKMSQGFDFERFFVKPNPSLQNQLNSVYFKRSEGCRNFTLIINDFEILDNPSESSYIGMIRLNLDLFENIENKFKYLNSIDTTIIVKGSRLDKILVAHSAGYMLLFINSSSKINANKRKSATYTEMLDYDSLVLNDMPLYKNEKLNQGFYRTYQDLLTQTNQLEFDTLKSCQTKKKFKVIKNGQEECYYKDSFYAIVYNQQVYVNVESKWYQVNFKQKEVIFTGLMLRIDKDYMKGLAYWSLMGVAGVMTGVIITDAINNTKTWHKIKISKKSGKPKVIGRSERPNNEMLSVDLSRFYSE
jgi:hypothetical protein